MQEQQFRQTLQSINQLQLQNNKTEQKLIQTIKNNSNLTQIMPISMQSNTNRENEIPSEFEPDKSIYKSFMEEFYTIKSNTNTSRYQKKKIFDDENQKSCFVSQISESSYQQCQYNINNQELHQIQQNFIQPKLISPSNYLDLQVNKLDAIQKQKFKQECLKDMKSLIIEVFQNKEILIQFRFISLRKNQLECQIIYQNKGTCDIPCLDILYSNDSMLKLSKQDDRFYNIKPNFGFSSNLMIEIVAIPFSFINLSIEYNNHFYHQVLPITILNFIEDQKTILQSNLQAKYYGSLSLKKKTNYIKNNIIQGQLNNYKIEIETKNDSEVLQFNCKSDLEQLNWQILNTLYFLFDL